MLGGWFRRGQADADMTEEMRLHLEQRTREYVGAGLSEADARQAASRKFGGIEQAKEICRQQRRGAWLEQLMQDVRYAVRTLGKHRGFTAVAVGTLALGIGVNTTLFSVIYGVLLAPYPYAKSGEIWAPQVIDAKAGRGVDVFRVGEFLEMEKMPGVGSAMATQPNSVTLRGESSPEVLTAPRLSGSAFAFLGVAPVVGRTFSSGDLLARGESRPVTVLSFKLWQRLFNGDPGAVGRTLMLNDTPHVILGVMPPRFGWYTSDGLWIPLSNLARDTRVNPIIRIAPGASTEVVRQQVLALLERVEKETPGRLPRDGFSVRLHNYLDISVSSGEMRSSLHLLFGAVGFLLLIACTNVANLQLARAATRGREIAIRRAIGAGRGRIVRQLLTESLVLSLVAGALGVGLAFALTQGVVNLMPDFYVPNEARVTLNGWVLLFSVAVSLASGVLFGLAPGLQCTRPDLAVALKSGGAATGTGDAGSTRMRNVLVVVEVALAIVLLVGASLSIRGFVEMRRIDRGFVSERVLLLGATHDPKRYPTLEHRNAFAREFLERVVTLPGVVSATVGLTPGYEGGSGITIPGQPRPPDGFALVYGGADFLSTLGIPLRAGRSFLPAEIERGERVAVINEAAAKLWPPGESPVGRMIEVDALVGGSANNLAPANAAKAVTIIGIMADTRQSLRRPARPAVVVPYTLRAPPVRTFAVRTEREPSTVLNLVRTRVRELDPEQPLRWLMLEKLAEQETLQPRFNMALFSLLAGIALALAAAGIYGVLSYHVTQRTREIGVRMALGASRRDVLGLVMGTGARLIGLGLVIGAVASIALTQLLSTQVFTVPLLDPWALAAAMLVLGGVGLLACTIPGRRATRVDPMVALRTD